VEEKRNKKFNKNVLVMIWYLRNQKNETVFEVEVWTNQIDNWCFVEVSPSVNIQNYSILLLESTHQINMIWDFYKLSELRGWLWEEFFVGKKNDVKYYDEVIEELRIKLEWIAGKYNLLLIQD